MVLSVVWFAEWTGLTGFGGRSEPPTSTESSCVNVDSNAKTSLLDRILLAIFNDWKHTARVYGREWQHVSPLGGPNET